MFCFAEKSFCRAPKPALFTVPAGKLSSHKTGAHPTEAHQCNDEKQHKPRETPDQNRDPDTERNQRPGTE